MVLLSALFASEIFEILSESRHSFIAECFMTGHVRAHDAKFDDAGKSVRVT